MQFQRKNHSPKFLLSLYKKLLKPRLVEEKMLLMLRQGKLSKWFSGIGQEAISVGAVAALDQDEYVLPLHRNLGVFTSREVPLDRLVGQVMGKQNGFTKGRDRSFHFGSNEHHIVGMISHLGPQLAVADGIALASMLANDKKVTLVFSGEGATSEGDFHEALNVAAVWNLPVIFLVENNAYSISTPTSEQYKIKSFVEKGAAYAIETRKIDGNNVLEVYETIDGLAKQMRKKPRPVLIEAVTFRMRGHEEASGTKYVPQELFAQWAKKDPIENYERFLLKEKILDIDKIDQIYKELHEEISASVDVALEAPEAESTPELELKDVYAPYDQLVVHPTGPSSSKRYIDAITDALAQSMQRHPNLVCMGQDIAEYGGVFKATEGLFAAFGKDRVRNTPLCESAIVGIGLGLSIRNHKAMVEMQFADFVTCGFNQIVNNLAKSHYRWGQQADVVIRMPAGAGTQAGPFHSQSNESWFFHTPGLKVVYAATPYDAKGLLNAAINDPNPVLFFEHKYLYRTLVDQVPDEYYTVPIGKARVHREGDELSIITYGMGVHWANTIAEEFTSMSIEIIDLRSLLPWDMESVANSIRKTGKVIVLNEDTITGSISAEIAAWIGEHLFEHLDAPVLRVGSLDTPIPFAQRLEEAFLPLQRLREAVARMERY